jgi:hypothetical protein
MLDYVEAKQLFVDCLTRDATAHETGRFADVGDGFDNLDGQLPRNHNAEFDKLFIALNFWDGWIDARNHDWRYYKGIGQADWPRLARSIASNLSQDREITDPLVLAHFDFRNRVESKGPIARLLDRILR